MTAAGALARFTGRLPARSIDEGVEPRGDGADACARLSAHVCAVVAAVTAADTAHRGCLLAKGAAELTEHDETVAERARAAIEALQTLLEGGTAACRHNGDVAVDADPGKPAAPMLTVLRGHRSSGRSRSASEEPLTDIAGAALAVLPRPAHCAPRAGRRPRAGAEGQWQDEVDRVSEMDRLVGVLREGRGLSARCQECSASFARRSAAARGD
ncbi:TetR family transcriptional regulator C-terminal domain-containing protein [Streptomyces tendae]|uniref:TetR family transcriptional regulator C-terminal domain-containing protein n=1 Tax=Streptomyces tendae TaxID=1932 RepID=UPI0036C52D39